MRESKKEPVLVIMAAGMGSRYGGLKQIDPIDEYGHIIMDFSLFDARRAGVKKVVFIIKKENEADFKAVIGNRMEKYMDVSYVFQDLHALPQGFEVPEGRVKPWGTGQAVLSCKDVIDGPFMVINADDYYGVDAFQILYDSLCEENTDPTKSHYSMVGYILENTLTENGHVARGICSMDENGFLTGIAERTHIEKHGEGTAYTEDDGKTWHMLTPGSTVSMNMWGFREDILKKLEADFPAFLTKGLKENPLKCEYFLPEVVGNMIREDRADVKVLRSHDRWYGVTYKEDKKTVVEAIRRLKEQGIYPERLWEEQESISEAGQKAAKEEAAKKEAAKKEAAKKEADNTSEKPAESDCSVETLSLEQALQAMKHFPLEGEVRDVHFYGNGHINDTYLVEVSKGEANRRLILQRINHRIFKQPEQLMENILKVTGHLRKKIVMEGGDPDRETLNVICAEDGKPYYKDAYGDYYRIYYFIEGAASFDAVRNDEDFYESARAFGHFQYLLSDFPAEELCETIPGFHDTAARYRRFCEVVEKDKCGRVAGVAEEIRFVKEHSYLTQALGELPLRVTHNDTKLNNIMLDEKTGKAVCVIDLDTVMPGYAVNDFGDSIRFGASTGAEDERDLSKINCSMELFEVYTKGFIEGCGGRLTQEEIKALPMGAMVMTYECGMRFLADYLEGDVYFKIHRERQNLDRARTQFKLVADMEAKKEQMDAIVEKYNHQ